MAACEAGFSRHCDLSHPRPRESARANSLRQQWELRLDRLTKYLDDLQVKADEPGEKENDDDR